MQEIRQVLEKYRCETGLLGLEVETVGVYKGMDAGALPGLQELNRSLPKPARFQTNFRITAKSLDPEIFRAFAAANVTSINIGLESGSERVRREVLKRNYSNAEFFRRLSWPGSTGSSSTFSTCSGFPVKPLSDHLETVRLNREARPNRSYTSIFFLVRRDRISTSSVEQRGLLTGHLECERNG